MYNSNEALKALTDALANIVDVQVDSVTDDKVSLYGVRGKITFGIFFDTQKQLFGFNLLTGGVKTFKSIEQFTAMFDTYAYINVVFIPKAKVVADTFEKDLSLNSVYKTFVGNKNIGFSAIFQVLGADTQLIVTERKEENLFKADYVQPVTGGEKNILSERYYVLSVEDDGKISCSVKLDVADVLDVLMKKSWEGADKFIDFKVLEGGIFEVTMKDFSYRMAVEITAEHEILFKLIAVNDRAVEPYHIKPEDWQDLSGISDSVLSVYDNMLKTSSEPIDEPTEVAEETIEAEESVEEEPVGEVAEPVDEEAPTETVEELTEVDEPTEAAKEVAEEVEESTENVAEFTGDAEESFEVVEESLEEVTEEPVAEETVEATSESVKEPIEEKEMNDLRLCLAYKGKECQGVLASLNNELILFDLDLVNNSNLYLDRVTESEEMETRAGIGMYPSERKFKKFAKRGTEDELNSVISSLFGF